MSTVTYNQAQFEKAAEIIKGLPPKGSVQLSNDQRLVVSSDSVQSKSF
jgi:hypothetical protein